MGAAEPHLRFHRAVRGAIVAEANFDSYREREVGWADVREAWMRPQRNGRPTPWEGLVGRAGARTGSAADIAQLNRRRRSASGQAQSACGMVPFSDGAAGADPSRGARVWIDEDHYYYARASTTPRPGLQRFGALIWRYAGQQVFSRNPTSRQAAWRDAGPDQGASGRIEPRPGIDSMIDADGGRWELDEVDSSERHLRRTVYEKQVRAQGLSEPSGRRPGPPDLADISGRWRATRFVRADRSYENECDQLVNTEYPLRPSGHPFNNRARKIVDIWTKCTGSGGSGVMIDDRHVLTAAHVIVDGDGNYLDTDQMLICAYGNCSEAAEEHPKEARCYEVGWAHAPDEALELQASVWGVGSSDWDFAVLTLRKVIEAPYTFGWMALSANDGGLTSVKDHHRGYPGKTPDCETNNDCPSAVVTRRSIDGCDSPLDPGSSQQYYAMGDVLSIWSGELEFSTSTAPGLSGAPHYYCPTGDCDDGHYVTAVHSGHTSAYSYGVKASAIRDWVLCYAFNYL